MLERGASADPSIVAVQRCLSLFHDYLCTNFMKHWLLLQTTEHIFFNLIKILHFMALFCNNRESDFTTY